MLLVGSALKGYTIEARDGAIGTVADLLFDDSSWKVRWIVVDTGTWLSSRLVLIHPSAVKSADHHLLSLTVALNRAEVKASPDILQDRPVSRQTETNLYEYYRYDPLWGASYFAGGGMAPSLLPTPGYGETMIHEPAINDLLLSDGDPHLRSIAAIKGYHIDAKDGEIGHLENVLLDDSGWYIGYLIVDTKNWWFGQHVLVSPFAVREINWSEQEVRLNIARAVVKASPAWDPAVVVARSYQEDLHAYYGWPGYGW